MYLFEFYYCGKFYPSCGISPQVACEENCFLKDTCVGDGMYVPDFFSSFVLI